MSWTIILSLLKKYKKPLIIGAVALGIFLTAYIWVGGLYSDIEDLNDNVKQQKIEIANLESDVIIYKAKIQNQDDMIAIQEQGLKYMEKYSLEETASENHYHKTIIENKEIIKEFEDNPDEVEARRKLYETMNERWRGVTDK